MPAYFFFFVKLAVAVGVNDRFTIGFSTHTAVGAAGERATTGEFHINRDS